MFANARFLPPPLTPPAKGGEFWEVPNYKFLPLDGGCEVGVKGLPRAFLPCLRGEEKTLTLRTRSGFLAFAGDWGERKER